MGFIVGFNRDRDSYQAAIAFAEARLLDCFVTDYYRGRLPVDLPTLAHRYAPSVPHTKVVASLSAFARQLPYEVKRRFGHALFPSAQVEAALGRTVASVARKMPASDLFLYSGSALAAFRGPSTGRRILFQYHPSPSYVERTMQTVDELGDYRPWIAEAEVNNLQMERTHMEELSLAERAVCASSFTRDGLVSVGMAHDAIHVVPYGCPQPTTELAPAPSQECRFLFVGQGVQRKGLHLLIEAWRRAGLRRASLTVIAQRMDPEIEALGAGVPGLELRGRVGRNELTAMMGACDTVVLPSLVEGFGLVLGEALASGARLIGSESTGLVDMGLPPEVGRVIPAGLVDPIADALRAAAESYDPGRPYRDLALAEAQRLSWASFRAGILAAAQA